MLILIFLVVNDSEVLSMCIFGHSLDTLFCEVSGEVFCPLFHWTFCPFARSVLSNENYY